MRNFIFLGIMKMSIWSELCALSGTARQQKAVNASKIVVDA